jgi:hypothetical protein
MPAPFPFSRPASCALLVALLMALSPALLESASRDDPPAPTLERTSADVAATRPASQATSGEGEYPVLRRAVAPQQRLQPHWWLHVSFAALQGLDVYSTIHAVGQGGREANPVLQGVANKPMALVAIKTGMTAAIIYATDRIWRKKPRTALTLMIVQNAAYMIVVAHNYRVSSQPRPRSRRGDPRPSN